VTNYGTGNLPHHSDDPLYPQFDAKCAGTGVYQNCTGQRTQPLPGVVSSWPAQRTAASDPANWFAVQLADHPGDADRSDLFLARYRAVANRQYLSAQLPRYSRRL